MLGIKLGTWNMLGKGLPSPEYSALLMKQMLAEPLS